MEETFENIRKRDLNGQFIQKQNACDTKIEATECGYQYVYRKYSFFFYLYGCIRRLFDNTSQQNKEICNKKLKNSFFFR